jgi:hypothetical protein
MAKEYGYGIVIKLQGGCRDAARQLNAQFAEELGKYGLKNQNNIWHVTLYHAVYKEEHLPQIWAQIKSLDLSNIKLNFSQIYVTADRWIDWLVDKTPKLESLHKQVVEIASPYHQGRLPRSHDVYSDMNLFQQQQVDFYGVSGILDLYKPHTSLFYQYPPNIALQEAAKIVDDVVPRSCDVESIILGELGYNGNMINILYDTNQ